MNGRCHKIVGTLTGITAALYIASPLPKLIAVPVCAISSGVGSLLPDIDKTNTKISNKTPIISTIVENTLGHRGIIHTPFIAMIISAIVSITLLKYPMLQKYSVAFVSFILGYLSHILLDSLTPAGTMLLYPITKKRYRIMNLKTSKKEIIVTSIALVTFTITTGAYIYLC